MLPTASEEDISAYSINKELTAAANSAHLIGMLMEVQQNELQLTLHESQKVTRALPPQSISLEEA